MTEAEEATEKLEDFMKRLEASSLIISVVNPWDTFVVRLDGWAFSRFTRAFFAKPFDRRFEMAMIAAAQAALTTFHAAAAYTHSDEITLFFPALCTREEFDDMSASGNAGQGAPPERPWGGRVVKLLTAMAGLVSVEFDRAARALLGAAADFPAKAFDARVVVFPDPCKMLAHQV